MDGLRDANIPLEKSENIEHLEILSDMEPTLKRYSISASTNTRLEIARKITEAKAEADMFLEMVPAIKALWADAGIQKTFHTMTHLHIQDSAK